MGNIRVIAASALLASMMFAAGCSAHAGYYYDPYDRRYYAPAEQDTFVVQWEGETHREHKDFKARNKDEQKQYWDWRHKHDKDHDKDHDKH